MKSVRVCIVILALFGVWMSPVGCGSGGGGSTAASPTPPSPSSSFFDWGFPFFYGRNVYTSITTDGGSGTYLAFSTSQLSPGSGANVQTINIDGGPTGDYPNAAFTSVKICIPGSTTECQIIDNVLVDTGSSGLRLLSSALTDITLTTETITTGGNKIGECVQFADTSYIWGPVQIADVYLGDTYTEYAHNVPIHVLDLNFPATGYNAPSDCSNGMTYEADDLADLGANGILGVGSTQYDCSAGGTNYCTSASAGSVAYYTCTSSVCTSAGVDKSLQVQNPVALFSTDYNGVIIVLPDAPGPTASLSGSMIFGITSPPATVFNLDANGVIYTNFTSTSTSNIPSFIDSGSNAYFFPDTSIYQCSKTSGVYGFYCSSGTSNDITLIDIISLAATITDYTNSTGVNFSVGDAGYMFSYPSYSGYAVFPALSGP